MVLAVVRMPTRTAALGPALPLGWEDCQYTPQGCTEEGRGKVWCGQHGVV